MDRARKRRRLDDRVRMRLFYGKFITFTRNSSLLSHILHDLCSLIHKSILCSNKKDVRQTSSSRKLKSIEVFHESSKTGDKLPLLNILFCRFDVYINTCFSASTLKRTIPLSRHKLANPTTMLSSFLSLKILPTPLNYFRPI